jgi:LEA14-like dessication related protein
MARAIGAALLTTGAAGCSGLGDNFREPDFNLNRVVVRGLGVSGGNLDLVMNVSNPNSFALRGTKLEAGFDVEGSHVGTVTYTDEYNVPDRDSSTITLPLRFDWGGVGSAFRSALQYGDIPYTLKGQATLSTPFGRRVVPFTKRGRAPLTRSGGAIPGLPPVSP